MPDFESQLCNVTGTKDPLTLILRGGDVVRYHTEGRAVPRQSVAEHSWRVMVILDHLWPASPSMLLMAALYHDISEGFRGDPPACLGEDSQFVKDVDRLFYRHVGCTFWRDMPPEHIVRLKCADYLEALIFAGAHRYHRGAADIVRRAEGLVCRCIVLLPKEEQEKVNRFLEYVLEDIYG